MAIEGVLFDFIGTIVLEKDPNVVNHCFKRAFNDHGINVTEEFIKSNRGKDKREVIVNVMPNEKLSPALVDAITHSLESHLEDNLENFIENEGSKETIQYLKKKGIKVGTGSGLPRETFDKIFNYLNWPSTGFDYIGIAAELGKGRPDPAMLIDMMSKHNIQPASFLKIGDTVADILEGKNAGALTAVILSGTQPAEILIAHHPDFVFTSPLEVKKIL